MAKTIKFQFRVNRFGGVSFQSMARTKAQRRTENENMAQTLIDAMRALGETIAIEEEPNWAKTHIDETKFTVRIKT